LAGDTLKDTRQHLITALKYRRTKPGCDESIELALRACTKEADKTYIRDNWVKVKKL